MIKKCEICGEESKALHLHMRKHQTKKTEAVKDEYLNSNEEEIKPIEKEIQQITIPNKELVVKLLCDKIPSLFDRFPQGSLSKSGVEKLVEEILNILK